MKMYETPVPRRTPYDGIPDRAYWVHFGGRRMVDLPGDLASCVDDEGFLADPGYANMPGCSVVAEVTENILKTHHDGWPEAGDPMDPDAIY